MINKKITINLLKILVALEIAFLFVFLINKIYKNQKQIEKFEKRLQNMELNCKFYDLDFCQWKY